MSLGGPKVTIFSQNLTKKLQNFGPKEHSEPIKQGRGVYMSLTPFKGSVARDFWPLVFFMNRPHMGP
jgi:hypothetical protein